MRDERILAQSVLLDGQSRDDEADDLSKFLRSLAAKIEENLTISKPGSTEC
jgi:hypothetical protein